MIEKRKSSTENDQSPKKQSPNTDTTIEDKSSIGINLNELKSNKRHKKGKIFKNSTNCSTERLRCEYLLPQKGNRQCSMTRRKNERFCALHLSADLNSQLQNDINMSNKNESWKKRVQCPYGPNHTVRVDQYKKHLKRCPNRPIQPKESWYKNDYNLSEPITEDIFIDINYSKWIPIVKETFKRLQLDIEEIPEEILTHEGLNNRMSELEVQKHAVQQSSLIGHMEQMQLLDSNNLYIEFGCGRAELSRYVAQAIYLKHTTVKNCNKLRFLLIDRDSCRMKMDTKIIKDYKMLITDHDDNKCKEPKVERIRADIKDVIFDEAVKLTSPIENQPFIAISKHLCGAATDLTIKCLENHRDSNYIFKAFIVALCCRQKCSYSCFPSIGKKLLLKHGIDMEGFNSIKKMTSWALCGRRQHMEHDDDGNDHPSGLTIHEREIVGDMCRRIIDYTRVESIKSNGWDAKLVKYVKSDVSKENVCMLVTPN